MRNGIQDIAAVRKQFPILSRKINGSDLVYFDNAATTQKPVSVIERESEYYRTSNANIHRGVHTLSRLATDQFEEARKTVAGFFDVGDPQQIIFTAGTTDGINLVAQALAKSYLQEGDEILLSVYEHHSNILPWQLWAQENGGKLRVIGIDQEQSLKLEKIEELIGPRTRLIVLAHVSNTLGVVSDVSRVAQIARGRGIPLLIDGAQSAPHMSVSLSELDPDFFVCSAHKMYGPMGVGVLYMSARWLHELSQARTGGGTIRTVSFEKTEYAEGALRFEPGTPNVAGVLAFAEALRWIGSIGMQSITSHEQDLVSYAQEKMKGLPNVVLYGAHEKKAAVISFNLEGQHPFDVGTLLDKYGIAVRTGHHCTQPLMQCLGTQGTVRISFAVYNTREEIDFFLEKLLKVIHMLKQ